MRAGIDNFVFIAPAPAVCGICHERAVCDRGERELQNYVCNECLPAVAQADQILAAHGFARPPETIAFTPQDT